MLGNTANYNNSNNNNKRVLATQDNTTRHEAPCGHHDESAGDANGNFVRRRGGAALIMQNGRHKPQSQLQSPSPSQSPWQLQLQQQSPLPLLPAPPYNKSLLACNLFPSPARTDRTTSAPPPLQLPLDSSPVSPLFSTSIRTSRFSQRHQNRALA